MRCRPPTSAKLSSPLRRFDTRTLHPTDTLESIRTRQTTSGRLVKRLANRLRCPRSNIVSFSRSKVLVNRPRRFRRASNQFPTPFATKCATGTSTRPLPLESPTGFSRRSKTRATVLRSRFQILSGTTSSIPVKETWKKTAITRPCVPTTTIAIRGRPSSARAIRVDSRIPSRFFLVRTKRARFRESSRSNLPTNRFLCIEWSFVRLRDRTLP